jgi:hypothetical protein
MGLLVYPRPDIFETLFESPDLPVLPSSPGGWGGHVQITTPDGEEYTLSSPGDTAPLRTYGTSGPYDTS